MQEKELRFLRIFTLVMFVLTLFVGQVFGSIPGAREPLIDRYALGCVMISIFLFSFILPPVKKNPYTFLFIGLLFTIADIAFIVAYNNTRLEYMLGFLMGYMIFTVFLKRSLHLNIFTTFGLSFYFLTCIFLTFNNFEQNLLNGAFLVGVIFLFYYWANVRINIQEVIEQTVIERTQSLQEEQAKLRSSIDAMDSGYIMVNTNNKILLANRKLQEIFNFTDTPENINEIQSKLGKAYNLKAKVESVINSKLQNSEHNVAWGEKYFSIFISPIISPASLVLGALVVIHDETEEKVLERSKDEFFTIASHELRTPLTIIKGNASLLLESVNGQDNALQLATNIETSSDRLIKIVNDFLDMSKIDQHKIIYQPEEFIIEDLIAEVLSEFENEAKAKNLVLENRSTAKFKINADKARVKQVLFNLIGNAIKFTSQGKVTVWTKLSDKNVEVNVADTGQGIPANTQTLLFRKFQQAGESLYSRNETGGTGLGLYISKSLIEGMGGHISLVESSQKGSHFAFTLPRVL